MLFHFGVQNVHPHLLLAHANLKSEILIHRLLAYSMAAVDPPPSRRDVKSRAPTAVASVTAGPRRKKVKFDLASCRGEYISLPVTWFDNTFQKQFPRSTMRYTYLVAVITGVATGGNRLTIRLLHEAEDLDFRSGVGGISVNAYRGFREDWLAHSGLRVPLYVVPRGRPPVEEIVEVEDDGDVSSDDGLGLNNRAPSDWSLGFSPEKHKDPLYKWKDMRFFVDFRTELTAVAQSWVRRNPTERSLWSLSNNSCHFDVFLAACFSIFVASDACYFVSKWDCSIRPFILMKVLLRLDKAGEADRWRDDARSDLVKHLPNVRHGRNGAHMLTGCSNIAEHIDNFLSSFDYGKTTGKMFGHLVVKVTQSCTNPEHGVNHRTVSCGSVITVPLHWYAMPDVEAAVRDAHGRVVGHRTDHRREITCFREIVLNRIARPDSTQHPCACSRKEAPFFYTVTKQPHETRFPLTLWFGFEIAESESSPPKPELEFTIGQITYTLVCIVFKSPSHYVANFKLLGRWFAYNNMGLGTSRTRRKYYTREIELQTYHQFVDRRFRPTNWCYVRTAPSAQEVRESRRLPLHDGEKQATTRVELHGLSEPMFNSLELLG